MSYLRNLRIRFEVFAPFLGVLLIVFALFIQNDRRMDDLEGRIEALEIRLTP